MRFAAPRAIGFPLVDYVVHGWDVAASLGIRAAYDEDLVLAAAEVARKEVPTGPSRERPGASFRPATEPAGLASAADRLLASPFPYALRGRRSRTGRVGVRRPLRGGVRWRCRGIAVILAGERGCLRTGHVRRWSRCTGRRRP
ncbi:hypothetical protein OH786_27475 [Streptomyces atratus]|uniref:hypothetical protein n=1 Tax=Streptomyces atratus TaxID=1893 RepID=UPI00325596D7